MNLLLFDSHELVNPSRSSELVISDHRAIHITQILKLKAGDSLRVGAINGKIGTANVISLSDKSVRIDIGSLEIVPPAKSPVELILALPRPKSLRRILRSAANIGIKTIHLIHSYRVDKSYWSAPALKPELLRATLIEGLSIAKDTVLPEIHLHRLFKPFVQDIAPKILCTKSFVAHPSPLPNVLPKPRASDSTFQTDHPLLLAIGSEGGFTDYEVGLFNEAGFETLSLGSRVLSVEAAIPTIETYLRGKFIPHD